VNGTNALHIALVLGGVKREDEVITQALTFVATPNAISYGGAIPVFIDVERDTLGMSPNALNDFLKKYAEKKSDGFAYNRLTGRRLAACVPMHTFGLPLRIDSIASICNEWNICLIEDSAEALGSRYKGVQTGNFGLIGTFSFNGNKTITCGGGGALITNSKELAIRAKHLTTQAKLPHAWRFTHDEIGYNYRMPNLNAAVICAQLEKLDSFLQTKRDLANIYRQYFSSYANLDFIEEIDQSVANYWLNVILFRKQSERDTFLEISNRAGVMTRPAWDLANTLPMFEMCQHDGLENSIWLASRLVNIPSSVRK
ncbi:MAG: LegC family aminotransferase, partial [Sphingobacteriales bacterium]